jgi:hypothetical protein
MAIDERSRENLERRLVEILGQEETMTLLESMPRGQPATKDDTNALAVHMGGLDQRMGGLDQRMDGLDQRMDGLDQRMDGLGQDMGSMELRLNERIDLKTQSAADRVSSSIHQSLAAQTRLYIFALVGALASIAALGFAT